MGQIRSGNMVTRHEGLCTTATASKHILVAPCDSMVHAKEHHPHKSRDYLESVDRYLSATNQKWETFSACKLSFCRFPGLIRHMVADAFIVPGYFKHHHQFEILGVSDTHPNNPKRTFRDSVNPFFDANPTFPALSRQVGVNSEIKHKEYICTTHYEWPENQRGVEVTEILLSIGAHISRR